jgi:hypothetical protein
MQFLMLKFLVHVVNRVLSRINIPTASYTTVTATVSYFKNADDKSLLTFLVYLIMHCEFTNCTSNGR